MKTFKTLTLFAIILTACGPNAKEQAAAEKAKMDSVAQAAAQETKLRMEMKLALQDSIAAAKSELGSMKEMLAVAKGDLEAALDKMNSIQEFKFGRSQSEREDQIRYQRIVIEELEEQIRNTEAAINAASSNISYFEARLRDYE